MLLNIHLAQGAAAPDLRRGRRFYTNFLRSSSENAAVKKLLKLVNSWVRNGENMKWMFLWNTVYKL